ncbi:MAG: 50S ribosomal protein L25/general stress protein Ctc [Hyphomicrobiales bacterium]|nr:50S ribosomal protein L25/general stress protein Ctc [Hyphomicrobiales bacterium]
MATETATLKAEKRQASGKGAARALRREGKLPGIIYGGSKAEETIALPQKEFQLVLQRGRFRARLLNLEVDGKTIAVLPRDVQFNPVTDVPEHADFQRIEADTKVKVMVPLQFLNRDKSPGLRRGGVLNVVRHEIELLCPPKNIPDSIKVDLGGAAIGDSIHVESVNLGEGVESIIKRNFTLATVVGRGAKDDDTGTTASEGAAEGAASEGAAAAAEPAKK